MASKAFVEAMYSPGKSVITEVSCNNTDIRAVYENVASTVVIITVCISIENY